MPCYHPVEGFQARGGGIAFDTKNGYVDLPMAVACGRCIGCRLDRSRDWAVRCMHEAQFHDHKHFVTFTYKKDPVSLRPEDYTKFMKRLRKKLPGADVRYFQAGEYGEHFDRPHHHAILYGVPLPDLREVKKNDKGDPLFASAWLDKIWGHGFCWIGEVTFESARYVASYCVDKVNGPEAEGYYMRILPTGEMVSVLPEYGTMSRNPAIGKRWFERFGADVYPSDFVVVGGKEQKPPKFYDKLLKRQGRSQERPQHKPIKLKRLARGNTPKARRERTKARLAVREEVKKAALSLKKRSSS